jgi:hypothetical protein
MESIRFTRHARNRLRLWKLSEADVTEVLRRPDRTTPTSHPGRTNAWKRVGDRWLRVTFTVEGETTVVITVTPRGRGLEED